MSNESEPVRAESAVSSLIDRNKPNQSSAPILVSISIVSHGHGSLISKLLNNLTVYSANLRIEVILTLNIPEELTLPGPGYPFPLQCRYNSVPLGFGANHNRAFRDASGAWFCVLNPDIELTHEIFAGLIDQANILRADLIAPAVLSPQGNLEDSVRKFPTPWTLLAKLLGLDDGRYQFRVGDAPFTADWVGGMFMLIRSSSYRAVRGFDEGFFLYYEDVDFCARLWNSGCRVMACPIAHVVHDARRTSRRRLRYMFWHFSSMGRYLAKHWGRLPVTAADT